MPNGHGKFSSCLSFTLMYKIPGQCRGADLGQKLAWNEWGNTLASKKTLRRQLCSKSTEWVGMTCDLNVNEKTSATTIANPCWHSTRYTKSLKSPTTPWGGIYHYLHLWVKKQIYRVWVSCSKLQNQQERSGSSLTQDALGVMDLCRFCWKYLWPPESSLGMINSNDDDHSCSRMAVSVYLVLTMF